MKNGSNVDDQIKTMYLTMNSIDAIVNYVWKNETNEDSYMKDLGQKIGIALKVWNNSLEKPHDLGWVLKKAKDSIVMRDQIIPAMNIECGFPADYRP